MGKKYNEIPFFYEKIVLYILSYDLQDKLFFFAMRITNNEAISLKFFASLSVWTKTMKREEKKKTNKV